MPKISCIMPVYNTAKYLDEAIESILNQTFTDFEFIISDDGSTDGSKDIIHKYAQKDDRIVFLDNPVNRGICANLNDMVKIAKGEYIAIMESDDISMPERFETSMGVFSNDGDLDFLSASGEIIDVNGNKMEDLICHDHFLSMPIEKKIFQYEFLTPSFIFKKNILDKIGHFKRNLAWDNDLFFRVVCHGFNIKVIKSKLIKKRMYSKSTYSRKYFRAVDQLLFLRLGIIKDFKLNNKKKIIYKCYISWLNIHLSMFMIKLSKKIGIYTMVFPVRRKYILGRSEK